MSASGVLTFRSAYNSGLAISNLTEGTYDHIGFFGAGGTSDAIIVGQYNGSTFITDASGSPNLAVWGALMNNKYLDASGVSISGSARIGIADATLQSETGSASGTLMIEFVASGAITISTYNAKLFAYDNTADIYTAPTDITLYGYEINPSGIGSTQWSSLQGYSAGLGFANHSAANDYMYDVGTHRWYAGVSARADSAGIIDDWNMIFTFQFA